MAEPPTIYKIRFILVGSAAAGTTAPSHLFIEPILYTINFCARRIPSLTNKNYIAIHRNIYDKDTFDAEKWNPDGILFGSSRQEEIVEWLRIINPERFPNKKVKNSFGCVRKANMYFNPLTRELTNR